MLTPLLVAVLPILLRGQISIETRTLAPVTPDTKGVNLILNQRIVSGGQVIFSSRMIRPDGGMSFGQRECRMDGTPVYMWQEGFWSDRWNRFETRYSGKGAEQQINETSNKTDMPDRKFRNPTALWFWKVQPKLGESTTVTFLAQNTIATFQIKFTYEGTDELTLAGKKTTAHRVREEPLSAKGVYTLWWYDAQGMGIKRYHKTTTSEYTDQLVAWK